MDALESFARRLPPSRDGEPPTKSRRISRPESVLVGRGSRESVVSFRSLRSVASALSAYGSSSRINKTSRRGRRRWPARWSTLTALTMWQQSPDDPWSRLNGRLNSSPARVRRFACQFCDRTFGRRFDWNRHETSVHVCREFWVCDVVSCRIKNKDDRSFSRKDHFMQHLENIHGISDLDKRRTACNRCLQAAEPLPSNHDALTCMSCGLKLSSWEQRVDHVAQCQFNTGPVNSEAGSLELDLSMGSDG